MRTVMPHLLSIIELGDYPDFSSLYREAGFTVEQFTSSRKAISYCKRNPVDVVVAEFNCQSDFRDRTSALESLLAVLQQKPNSRAIIFYHRKDSENFAALQLRFPVFATLTYPIVEEELREKLRLALEGAVTGEQSPAP
ncbi:MAG: hypothetical protein HQL48_06640 [Gammaproteobacteria bacterium]|nr:hypothetical protein [Gammaproteobacteria bacterium]